MEKYEWQSGFTLIELMITVAVLAVALSIGIPSFRTLMTNNRVTAEVNDFVSALNIARSEAIKRRDTVTLTATSGSSWELGWSVADSGGTTIRVQQAFDSTSTLRGTDSDAAAVSSIAYDSGGYLSSAKPPFTFSLCNAGASANREKQVTIVAGGRVNMDSDHDCP